jgi:hypothetical protein
MATYRQIQDDIRQRYGRTVETCWIAQCEGAKRPHPQDVAESHLTDCPEAPVPAEMAPGHRGLDASVRHALIGCGPNQRIQRTTESVTLGAHTSSRR